MKISIITPTFNSAATLEWNLKSVANQTYSHIEHIVVDNKSTDGTLALLQKYPHVTKVVSEKDRGIYDAMNKGISLATGDIIGILNSDDYLAGADVLESIALAFATDIYVEATYGNLVYVQQKKMEKIHRLWVVGGYSESLFYQGWMLPHPTFYVRREVYAKYGLFDTSYRFAGDYDLILRFLLVNKIAVHPIRKTIVYMKAGGASNKSIFNRLKVHREDHLAWKRNGLKPNWYTVYLKPARKVFQYLRHHFMGTWRRHLPPTHDSSSFLHASSKASKMPHSKIHVA